MLDQKPTTQLTTRLTPTQKLGTLETIVSAHLVGPASVLCTSEISIKNAAEVGNQSILHKA